ncbi:glycosyltransferase family 2 protein [soil metagenome]
MSSVPAAISMIPDISFTIAVFNEDPENLNLLARRLAEVAISQELTYELIFINDGSRKPASDALRLLASSYDCVKLIELSRNFGQQAAITAGLKHSTGRVVVNLDSDLQDPPEIIIQMLEKWRDGYDVVYAQRSTRKDSFLKRFSAFLFYRLLGKISTVSIPPDTGDFRLMDRKVVTALVAMPERTRFIRGLIPWLGFRQIPIAIDRDAREAGKSGYTLSKLLKLAFDGLLSFSMAPLFLVPCIGLTVTAVGLLLIAIWMHSLVDQRFAIDGTAIVGFGALAAGLQILATGTIAIYLSKVLDEVRGRPIYVVSQKIGNFGESRRRELEHKRRELATSSTRN